MYDDPTVKEIAERTKTNRRDLIKRALALGPAAYVAPMILGSASTASAQVSSACGCSLQSPCNTAIGCQNNVNCNCWVHVTQGFCFCGDLLGNNCGVSTPCATQADCSANPGWACIANCCPQNQCYPPCGVTTQGNQSAGNGQKATRPS